MENSIVPFSCGTQIGFNSSCYSFTGQWLGGVNNFEVCEDEDSPAESIARIQHRIESQSNIGYALGSILKSIWDNMPSFTLPQAAAVSVPNYKSLDEIHEEVILDLPKDEELELALLKAQFEFHYDPDITPPAREEEAEVVKNLANELRIAAAKGPETRALILRVIRDMNVKIVVLNNEKSSEKIEAISTFGNNPLGMYDTDTNECTVRVIWDGKFNSGVMVHEFGHADEYRRGLIYDEKILSDCFKGLDKWQNILFKYLERDMIKGALTKHEPSLREYRGLYFHDSKSNMLSMFGSYYDKESKILTLNFGGAKGVNFLSRVIESATEDYVIHEPFEVVNLKTKKSRSPTEEEKLAYNAYFMAYQSIHAYGILASRYEAKQGEDPEIWLKEMNAHLKCLVPERVINNFCHTHLISKSPTNNVKKREDSEAIAVVKTHESDEKIHDL